MQTLNRLALGSAGIIGFVLLGMVLGAPAGAGTIYSWQTADGDVAFTDDAKKVPERYRSQVETRSSEDLSGYARFTSKDPAGTKRYEDQLAERVAYLRELNASTQAPRRVAAAARGSASIEVAGMNLRVPASEEAAAPIVVERVRVRRYGQIVSRHDTVVSQGGRTIAVVRGRQEGELGGASSIADEEDIELYR